MGSFLRLAFSTPNGFSTIFLLSVFFDLLGIAMIVPLMGTYSEQLGLSRTSLGIVQAVYGVMQVICTPLLGSLADAFGPRPVLLLSMWGTASAFVLLLCSTFGEGSLVLFFLSRITLGAVRQTMSIGGALAINSAIQSRGETAESAALLTAKSKNLSLFNAAASSGFVVGPALGGLIVARTSLRFLPICSIVVGALAGLGVLYSIPAMAGSTSDENANQKERPKIRSNPIRTLLQMFANSDGLTRRLMLAIYLNSFAYIMTQSYQPIAVAEYFQLDAAARGVLISVGSAVNTLSQATLLGFVTSFFKVDAPHFIRVATFGTLCGYAVMTWAMASSHQGFYAAGFVIISLCSGVCDSIARSAFASKFSEKNMSETMSIITSVDGFNRVVGPIAAGFVADRFSSMAPGELSLAAACLCSFFQFTYFSSHVIVLDHKGKKEQ